MAACPASALAGCAACSRTLKLFQPASSAITKLYFVRTTDGFTLVSGAGWCAFAA
jgi:hypothetical protein